MQLIKLNNGYYYLLSDKTENTGGKFIMWCGEATKDMNKHSIFPNLIYSGKPADGYRLVVATTDTSFKKEIPMIDMEQLERVWNNRTYSVEDMRRCFDEAREKITHPDWDYIHDNFEDFMRSLNNESEWKFEVETVTVPVHSKIWDKLIGETRVKVNEQGFVTIKSITIKK